jgi:predicted DNA-binding transcriptional regulator AlpA
MRSNLQVVTDDAVRPPPTQRVGVFIGYDELAEHIGIAITRRQLRRLISAGTFPRPFQISANRIAWKRSEVEEFLEARPVAVGGARGRNLHSK